MTKIMLALAAIAVMATAALAPTSAHAVRQSLLKRPGNVHVGVRPEDVAVSRREGQDAIQGTVAGKVSLPMINATIFRIHVAEHEVYAEAADEEDLRAGDQVWLTFKQYHLFDKESGLRLRSFPETSTARVEP